MPSLFIDENNEEITPAKVRSWLPPGATPEDYKLAQDWFRSEAARAGGEIDEADLSSELSPAGSVAPTPSAPKSSAWDTLAVPVKTGHSVPASWKDSSLMEKAFTPLVDRSETLRKADAAINESIDRSAEQAGFDEAASQAYSPALLRRFSEMRAAGKPIPPEIARALDAGPAMPGLTAAVGAGLYAGKQYAKDLTSPAALGLSALGPAVRAAKGGFPGLRKLFAPSAASEVIPQGEALLARSMGGAAPGMGKEVPMLLEHKPTWEVTPAGQAILPEASAGRAAYVAGEDAAELAGRGPAPAARPSGIDIPEISAKAPPVQPVRSSIPEPVKSGPKKNAAAVEALGPKGPATPSGPGPQGALGPTESAAPAAKSVGQIADELLSREPELPSSKGKGVLRDALRHPGQTATKFGHWLEEKIDPSSPLLHYAKKVGGVAGEEAKWLYKQLRTHGDKAKKVLENHSAFVTQALSPLKDYNERKLFNIVYSLKHFRGQYYIKNLDYGGIGSQADGILAELQRRTAPEVWKRVNDVTETFSEAMNTVGWKSVEGRAGMTPAKFENFIKRNPYYMFASPDNEAAQIFGAEVPTLEKIFSRHLQQRKGFEQVPVLDPVKQFAEYHFKRILAHDRERIISGSISRFGLKAGSKEAQAAVKSGEYVPYEFQTPKGTESVLIPKVIEGFLRQANNTDVGVFASAARELSSVFRIGALNLNPRAVLTAMPRRDLFDTVLRSRGYLTPADEYLGQKVWNPIMKKLGAKGLMEEAPDLDYALRPAIWLKAVRTSLNVNFPKASERIFKHTLQQIEGNRQLYSDIAKHGAIQMGDAKGIVASQLPRHLRSGREQAARVTEHVLAQSLMKFMDDTWRIGQSLRSLGPEFRGAANAGKVAKATGLSKMSWDDVLNVRGTNIDFNMKGDWLRRFDAISPFLNAMVQDKYQTIKFAQAQPFSAALRTTGFMSAAIGSYLALRSRPDDPIVKFPEQDKNRYIMADTGIRHGDNPVFAPLGIVPDSIQPAWIAVRKAIDIALAKDPDFREALKDRYMSEVGAASLGAMGNLGGPVVATGEVLANRSLYKGGRSIEREGDKHLSKELRAAPGTENLYRLIAQKTGITSPDKLKHLARGFTGTLGDVAADAVDPLVRGHVKMANMEMGDPEKARFSVSGSLLKGARALGLTREGRYDPEYDTATTALSSTMQNEKDLMAQLKHWHVLARYSQNPKVQELASSKRAAVIQELISAANEAGVGVPDINTILESLDRDMAFERNVPQGKLYNKMPRRFWGKARGILENEAGE